jgi:hypothetical protein
LQIKSVVAVAKKVEARNNGRSPKEHVEPARIVTSETVIHSRDKKHDRTDLTEQSQGVSLRYRVEATKVYLDWPKKVRTARGADSSARRQNHSLRVSR